MKNKSPKEIAMDKKIQEAIEALVEMTSEKDDTPVKVCDLLMNDMEIELIQNYANDVSIMRLGFNDHGPVHMRTVCYNAIKMLGILYEAGIKTSLLAEEAGSFADSVTAVILASFMHDFGMTIGRQDHELYSVFLALPQIERILNIVLPGDENMKRRVMIRSVAMEGIVGHMGTRKIHSIEAGLVLIADGCDMTKGRARIPMALDNAPRVGDIHKYSANSIENVTIMKGVDKPIRIEVEMGGEVGFFQIEEVLLQKVSCSPDKQYVELFAGVTGKEMKQYL